MRKKVKIIRPKGYKAKPKEPSYIEKLFEEQFKAAVLEFQPFIPCSMEPEYKYSKVRKFAVDYAFLHLKIAIELQGGIGGKMGHSSWSGITRDCIKYNDLQRLGWKVFKFTSQQVTSRYAINWLINYFISQNDYYNLFVSEWDLTMIEIERKFNEGIMPTISFRDTPAGSLPILKLKIDDKKQP